MRRTLQVLVAGLAVVGALTLSVGAWMAGAGVSSRPQPSALETRLARGARHLLIPWAARAAANPVAPSAEVLTEARRHFADHCASCHGNDGRGQTGMGRALYPKAPDMTARATQQLSDGELFWIIENGVRLTGMPAWGADSGAAGQSWGLVHFIRQLPQLAAEDLEDMKNYNPVSPTEMQEMHEEKEFLEGGGTAPQTPHAHGGEA